MHGLAHVQLLCACVFLCVFVCAFVCLRVV